MSLVSAGVKGEAVGIYLLKVNNRNTRPRGEVCVFIVNFEHVIAGLEGVLWTLWNINDGTIFAKSSIIDVRQAAITPLQGT